MPAYCGSNFRETSSFKFPAKRFWHRCCPQQRFHARVDCHLWFLYCTSSGMFLVLKLKHLSPLIVPPLGKPGNPFSPISPPFRINLLPNSWPFKNFPCAVCAFKLQRIFREKLRPKSNGSPRISCLLPFPNASISYHSFLPISRTINIVFIFF